MGSFFLRFIYLFRERERQRHRQREEQAPHRKPDMGLDPRAPGSHPKLQEALNHCATGAALITWFLKAESFLLWSERHAMMGEASEK